jgi:hypothetical protein
MIKHFKNLVIIIGMVVVTYSAHAQTCTCESNFEWMKKTFEENDAGFQYIIDKRGEAAYNIHNQLMSDKIKNAKTSTECTGLLYEWLAFFRSGHIRIERLTFETPASQDVSQTENKTEYETWGIETQTPYLETLNATTLYLRIPSFDGSEKSAIDSVIAANKDKILKTENLIIDLRNNGGGSDPSFEELLPFLYTNPVRTVSVEFLSTKQNNQLFLDLATNADLDEDSRQWAKDIYDKLQNRLGEFVFLFDVPVSIDQQDTVYEYPKNVGIIVHEKNVSTTEQFLLAAKQSKKVKLFGVTTGGALDISNMYSVESPCKEFNLWYCLSRSLRIPDMTIDDIGLQPDYYIDKTIPQYKWVEFVNEVLNQ